MSEILIYFYLFCELEGSFDIFYLKKFALSIDLLPLQDKSCTSNLILQHILNSYLLNCLGFNRLDCKIAQNISVIDEISLLLF